MLWLALVTVAIAFVAFGTRLKKTEAVLAITVNCAGLVSVIWGLTVAPPSVRLRLGFVLLSLQLIKTA